MPKPSRTRPIIALTLGLVACLLGHRVRFTTTAALVSELIEARDEKKLLRFQKQIASCELQIRLLKPLDSADWMTDHVPH